MSDALRYLQPDKVRAWKPSGGVHLRFEIVDDRTILAARIKRVFPLSEPERYLSVQDGAGKEVGILTELDGVEATSAQEIREHLDRRYYTPRIERILTLRQEAGMWRFVVETHRGPNEFFVRNWRDSANEISPRRWHIYSVDGGRFEIVDLEALDAQSRRLLDQLL